MTDHAELRRLAEEVIRIERSEDEPISSAWELFDSAANPKAILALLDQIDGLSDELSACTEHPGGCGYWREAAKRRAEDRDRLKAENEALRKIISECATACGAGCAPECTLEFMSMLPGEISSVVSRRATAEIGKSMTQPGATSSP
ncbi:hypothetical protein ACSOT0_20310 [Pseudomonas aeruginosa]|uniref:hypothetical protein n=1 Tax=Pseudomonas aeruginosa TaxID=287 RepID=UPI003F1D0B6A